MSPSGFWQIVLLIRLRHSQQAAEKALKGSLEKMDDPFNTT